MESKNKRKVVAMQTGGMILAKALAATREFIRPGKKLIEAENFARHFIRQAGAKAAFSRVPGYHWATCINLNEGIVHGIPDEKKFKRGDLISLDMGVYYRGYNTDMAYSWELAADRYRDFLAAGEKALAKAIIQAKTGNKVKDISRAIQDIIEKGGVGSCSRELTGHGVGDKLHKDPFIPGFVDDQMGFYQLASQETLAIEVIYSAGAPDLAVAGDGWTIATRDGKISALFEKTVVVTKSGGQVLTPYLWETGIHG